MTALDKAHGALDSLRVKMEAGSGDPKELARLLDIAHVQAEVSQAESLELVVKILTNMAYPK